MKEDTLQFERNYMTRLFDAMRKNDEEEIKEIIGEICEDFRKYNLTENKRRLYGMNILNMVLDIVGRYELSMESVFGEDVDYLTIVHNISSASGMEVWLTSVFEKVIFVMRKEVSNRSTSVIQKAKRYIREHYTETSLSLDTVCEQLNISPTYFSAVFKKETGENFITYVTRIRIEHAKELLDTTEDKTYIISEKVGFSEANYFSYVFKKQVGVTPVKYRNKG